MGRFENRKLCRLNTCPYCKHCWTVDLDYNEPPYEEYFCLLDLSEEDREFIETEADDNQFQLGRLTGEDFSDKALKLLKWNNPEELPPDSERIVSDCTSCQYFNE